MKAYAELDGKGICEPAISTFSGRNVLSLYEKFKFADGDEGIIIKELILSSVSNEFSITFFNGMGFSHIINSEGSGKATLNISEINLAEIVEELATIIRPQAKAKNQTFDISVRDIQQEHLLGDKLRIEQIMINLLSNAVKYTHENGRIEMIIEQIHGGAGNYALA